MARRTCGKEAIARRRTAGEMTALTPASQYQHHCRVRRRRPPDPVVPYAGEATSRAQAAQVCDPVR